MRAFVLMLLVAVAACAAEAKQDQTGIGTVPAGTRGGVTNPQL